MVDDRTALMSARALGPGYEVLWYTIERVLGQGGFGITYLAHDRNLDRKVAIKEYLPTTFAYRHEDYSVKPITGDHRDNFVWGLGSFLKEAQTLARFSHPNVVRVHSVFEENNTAYMVMEYEHGQNLASVYKQTESFTQEFFEQIFYPVFNGLKAIHTFGFIHRDIKPANIYIRQDGTPVLIDFGSARQTSQQQTGEMTTLVSQGYTPLEQYSANYGDQGPWTDIYALAATLYEGVVGKKPDESLSRSACLMRSKPDLLETLNTQRFPHFEQHFLDAIMAGLILEPELRPQTLEAWQLVFEQGVPSTALDSDKTLLKPSFGFTELETGAARFQPQSKEPQPHEALVCDLGIDDFDSIDELGVTRSYREVPSDQVSDAFDSFEASSAKPGTLSSTARGADQDDAVAALLRPSQANRLPVDDIISFDDEDLDTESRHRKVAGGEKPLSRQAESTISQARWFWPSVVSLVLLVVAGGLLYFTGGKNSYEPLTSASLASLPKPGKPIVIELPQERVQSQLNTLLELAKLQQRAFTINPNDRSLLASITSSSNTLLSIARQWNASQYQAIADSVLTVSKTLPPQVHNHQRIESLVNASNQVTLAVELLKKLEAKNYLIPAGNAVIDQWVSASAADTATIKNSELWQQMMAEFKHRALRDLNASNFDEVARLAEAALTLSPGDVEFNQIRQLLAGQT